MNEPLSGEKSKELLSIYAAIERRLAKLLPEKLGLLGALLSSRRPPPPTWRQETDAIIRALAANSYQELASLMNLHSLNAAIEAARYQDAKLVRQAERLRRFTEEVRNFTVKQ